MEDTQRERRLTRAFVEMADTLVADFDVVDFLHTLVTRCVELLDASEAGLMLADQRGGMRLVASSSERARLLEVFEIQSDQGPCTECLRNGQPVSADDLDSQPDRWPQFAARAREVGFRSAHALPMRCRNQVIGALNLFRLAPGGLSPEDSLAGQALADVATIGILQERAVREARILAEQLQSALNSRVVIEQAKGVLAERAGLSVDDAFRVLRSYARSRSRPLREVAEAVIGGVVSADELGSGRTSHAGS